MITTTMENKICTDRNILIISLDKKDLNPDISYLIANFCGEVFDTFSHIETIENKKLYVCGDVSKIKIGKSKTYIIKEFSSNYENLIDNDKICVIELGQVPIMINNVGVFFRKLFHDDLYFEKIQSEHTFQALTESTKASESFRKGIYLTEIVSEKTNDKDEILHFRLLRCSSNLSGATDNFRQTDHQIINQLNEAVKYVFEQEVTMNHVLVQIYENKINDNKKEVKAKIKAHSDKTKDMPKEGLIAFCTFYDMSNANQIRPSNSDKYDWCYKQTSALTRLHFKLKNPTENTTLAKEFSVTLYPNSVFIIPLSTNRLYTHEIKPSVLGIDKIPIRMGYVVRCSNVEALYMNKQTYIKEHDGLHKLENMTPEMLEKLRNSYYKENTSEEMINYGEIHFSMNTGDYEKPIY